MALPFRRQIFAWLVAIALVPASIAVAVWVLSPQVAAPVGGAQAWEEAAASWITARRHLDSLALSADQRAAMEVHDANLGMSLRRARQAQRLRTDLGAKLAAAAIALAVLVGGGAIRLAGHLSRQLSRPIDELVEWTGRLRRGEPLPDAPPVRGAPEFRTLRDAFRATATALEHAREQEIEAARLRTFRNMARQVAHELKNPLTPMRFALQQLREQASPASADLIGILDAESQRIEQMARDFADLGRLPEGPAAPIDLGELLDTLSRPAPEGVRATVVADPATPRVTAHYEPLRRAIHNLFLNACQAGATGIDLEARPTTMGGEPAVEVVVRDDGPGMAPEVLAHIFEPYFTTRSGGTGLGLALARQTVHDHRGTMRVESTPGHGTTFTIRLPVAAA